MSRDDACKACPAHDATQLVRLGIDMADCNYVVAIAGNPNTGNNRLTGLRQHTGNWPGKTVARAEGAFSFRDARYKLVDLPGTYSLLSASRDEEIARDFLLFGKPDVTVIVVDASRLERNLNLVLQVMEITDRVVVCLNLMDEAKRHGLTVDARRLGQELGVPVVPTSARFGEGIVELTAALADVASGAVRCRPRRLASTSQPLERAVAQLDERLAATYPELPNRRWVALRLLDGDERIAKAVLDGDLGEARAPADPILSLARSLRWDVGVDFHHQLVESIYGEAGRLAGLVVAREGEGVRTDRRLDRLLTSRRYGLPIMVLLLVVVLWLTVAGANAPSRLLATLLLDTLHPLLKQGAAAIGLPGWLDGLLIDGVFLATAWVVSVMLPPMAIFFPLFTLLEDFGYLPRVAFNLDRPFRRVGAHGKQALTMCMGFGCNAAGVIATRVIDSPRERLVAILTNNFALCNGRWPTQILIATVFLGALVPAYLEGIVSALTVTVLAGIVSALTVLAVALLGVALTFLASWLLTRTVLRGEASTFSLELPPYRPPRLLQTIYTSLIDRTIFVLWRAILFAAPAGALIWLTTNIHVGDASIAEHLIGWLDPVGLLLGLNGVILLAYVVAIPANEIVIPTVMMLTVLTARLTGVGEGTGVLFELESMQDTEAVLRAGGWTLLTGVSLMLFSLLHNPCSTTLYTIYKETRSWRWTMIGALLPLAMGVGLCFVVTQAWRFLAGA
ncbi:MAG: ferrous iron transport protein B [Planctomycetota bacterium]|jgi:ferrous iron transport protein B